jgi:RNA polymerase sigma-70 factor (ECF subfamily)
VAWRTERLIAAGVPGPLARPIAADCGYDLHAVLSDRPWVLSRAGGVDHRAPRGDPAPVLTSPITKGEPGAVSVPSEVPQTMSLSRSDPSTLRPGSDDESRAWLQRLRSGGHERDQAHSELRELLLSAARFELNRRSVTLPHLRGGDREDLAQQTADDALLAILAKLEDFRGEARFTTWAYKFALLEAAVKLRRLAWQGREIPLEPEHWDLIADRGSSPAHGAETGELIAALRDAIEQMLTPHQRQILVALTLNDVPIDVLSERLNTTRGALYKTLHDARRKLRTCLSEQGFEIESDKP